ncbi:MAG TPA: helix-turn-helix domain-containing protein [Candidatus Limnocylindrales bacterium]|nr:helix-turn-helix domain-containing protein [Candidatus Limnocylindrales bacterium]
MSINESTRNALREMGLNAYEIDAYVALLEVGQMTAMEISQEAKVPYSKMYEVLNSLKEKGWIKSSESRPFKYYPVPPLEATKFTKLRLEDKYLSWENTVAETLQPLYEKRELVERTDMLILRGQQAVLSKLEEVLSKASKEIVIAAPEFAKPVIALAEPMLEGGLKKNVRVKLMAAGKKEDWLFIKKHPVLNELRIRDHMFGGGVIADGKEAMLFLGEDKPSLVIWSNHLGLVGFAREYFQFLWDSSATA